MQPFRRSIFRVSTITLRQARTPARSINTAALRPTTSTTKTSSFQKPQSRSMSSSDLNIESINQIKTASGVTLDDHQKTIVGSVLDLFAGRPSLEKLKLWSDEGTFEDPITIANGRKQYEPQWYGLQTAFSEIERLHHEVTSSGNPITMDLKTRYKVKGIGMEKTIDSKINIYVGKDGKIEKVEDKWNGKLPESAFVDVLRNLNSVTVPLGVSVPKTKEEDRAKGN